MEHYCIAAFVIGIAALMWGTYLILGANVADSRMVKGLREAIELWKQSTTSSQKVLIFCTVLAQIIFRTGRWAVLVAFYGIVGAGLGAVCEFWNWVGILRELRTIMEQLPKTFNELFSPSIPEQHDPNA